jgi:hypothetical protein
VYRLPRAQWDTDGAFSYGGIYTAGTAGHQLLIE